MSQDLYPFVIPYSSKPISWGEYILQLLFGLLIMPLVIFVSVIGVIVFCISHDWKNAYKPLLWPFKVLRDMVKR